MKLFLVSALLFSLATIAADQRFAVWTKALHHDNPLIRKQAVVQLGWLRDRRTVEHLVPLLETEADDFFKIAVVKALLRTPTPRVKHAVEAALRRERSRELRRALLHAKEVLDNLTAKDRLMPDPPRKDAKP